MPPTKDTRPEFNWNKVILAENLKFFRSKYGYSQSKVAAKAKVSFRLIQDLERGKGNPTLDTLYALSDLFETSVSGLLTVKHARINASTGLFVDRFKTKFNTSPYCVVLRTTSGSYLWGNEQMNNVNGHHFQNNSGTEIKTGVSFSSRSLLEHALSCEKRGIVNSYTIAIQNKMTGADVYLRAYPTLILPLKGSDAILVALYIAKFENDMPKLYLEYCHSLLEIARLPATG